MKRIALIIIALIWSLKGQAQSDSTLSDSSELEPDVVMISNNADSAFTQARELAFKKEYKTSRKVLDLLLLNNPENYQYKLFKARTYMWEGEHQAARENIEYLISEDTTLYEPYEMRVLNELYDKDYEICVRHCNDGIQRFPKQNEFFYVQKAQALTSANEYHDALDAANEAEEKFPENNEVQQLKTFLLNQLIVDGVAVGAFMDYFTKNYNPWLYGFVQVGRQTNLGAFIARVNMAERFQEGQPSFGVQGEIDAYPRIGRKSYGYLNVGYSPSQIYPNFRFGAEVYTMVGNTSLEASLGMRYLDFLTNQVLMYTGSLGYYWKDNYAQFRPFLIQDNTYAQKGFGLTFNFLYRKFIQGKGDFFQVNFGFGEVPDDRVLFLTNGFDITDYRLYNQNLGFAYQRIANDNWYTRFDLILTRQENFSVPDDYLQIVTVGLTVGYRF